jgi:hypothetical protein
VSFQTKVSCWQALLDHDFTSVPVCQRISDRLLAIGFVWSGRNGVVGQRGPSTYELRWLRWPTRRRCSFAALQPAQAPGVAVHCRQCTAITGRCNDRQLSDRRSWPASPPGSLVPLHPPLPDQLLSTAFLALGDDAHCAMCHRHWGVARSVRDREQLSGSQRFEQVGMRVDRGQVQTGPLVELAANCDPIQLPERHRMVFIL